MAGPGLGRELSRSTTALYEHGVVIWPRRCGQVAGVFSCVRLPLRPPRSSGPERADDRPCDQAVAGEADAERDNLV